MAAQWGWVEGRVDEAEEHLLLSHGPVGEAVPVARVSAPSGTTFRVQFLGVTADEVRTAVRAELDFYLVEKGEPDPWRYARYHCGTAANVYSNVRWSYHPA